MADPTYHVGTASVNAAGTTVTGQGTAFLTAGIQAGDRFWAAGLAVRVASVVSNTQLTLAYAWPGASRTADTFEVEYVGDIERLSASTQALIEQLSNGKLASIAAVTVAADQVVYATGAGSFAATALTSFARSILDDANAGAVLSTLGVTTFAKTILDDADAGTVLSTLGVSTFAKTILDDVDAATVRATIGAQATLAYTPVNKAGDTITGTLNVTRLLAGYSSAGHVLDGPTSVTNGNFTAGVSFLSRLMAGYSSSAHTLDGPVAITNGNVTMSNNLSVSGALSKGSGTFLIDHPLDPDNWDLAHGFIEGPRYDLIYRGEVRLEAGRATVDIDGASSMRAGTFAALTTFARVAALHNQDGFARLRAAPVDAGKFEIVCEDEASTDTVTWLVFAERNDAFVKSSLDPNCDAAGRFVPEREKEAAPAKQRRLTKAPKGKRLVETLDTDRIGRRGMPRHPEAFGRAAPMKQEAVPDEPAA